MFLQPIDYFLAVWFALAGPGLVRTWKVLFSGDRVLIQTSAEEEALRKLLEAVEP